MVSHKGGSHKNKVIFLTGLSFFSFLMDLAAFHLSYLASHILSQAANSAELAGSEIQSRPALIGSSSLLEYLVYIILFAVSMVLSGIYRNPLSASENFQAKAAMKGVSLYGALLILLNLFRYHASWSGLIALCGFLLIAVPLDKLIIDDIKRLALKKNVGRIFVAVCESLPRLCQAIDSHKQGVYAVKACFIEQPVVKISASYPVLPLEGLKHWLEHNRVDLVCLPWNVSDNIRGIALEACKSAGLPLKRLYEAKKVNIGDSLVHHILGETLWSNAGEPAKWKLLVKRSIDLLISSIALVVTAPLFIMISVAIALESRGGVFFLQERVTKGGRRFKMIKFRSMYPDAQQRFESLRMKSDVSEPLFKLRKDPRVTRVGRLLRRFSLDELPQLINVFLGDISLVGPRPGLPEEVERYLPWQQRRLQVKGGLTGLWQVSGRSDLDFEEMVLLDLYYIEHFSLLLDFEIIVETAPTILTGRGAY